MAARGYGHRGIPSVVIAHVKGQDSNPYEGLTLICLCLSLCLPSDALLVICRYDVPLVADIHFQPVVANMVAECFEKIRVNPGNFVDGRKRFDEKVYDDDSQFRQEQEHIREVLSSCWSIVCKNCIHRDTGSMSANTISIMKLAPCLQKTI